MFLICGRYPLVIVSEGQYLEESGSIGRQRFKEQKQRLFGQFHFGASHGSGSVHEEKDEERVGTGVLLQVRRALFLRYLFISDVDLHVLWLRLERGHHLHHDSDLALFILFDSDDRSIPIPYPEVHIHFLVITQLFIQFHFHVVI